MIREPRRLSLIKRHTEVKRAETRLETARRALKEEIYAASREDKTSYQEIGTILGLSRQRIHQLIGGKK